MSTVAIYTLTNPLTGLVFYVGATSQPLYSRLSGHARRDSVVEITKSGHYPVIDLIDECSECAAKETEDYWIEQLRAWGFPLENKIASNYHKAKQTKSQSKWDSYSLYLSRCLDASYRALNATQSERLHRKFNLNPMSVLRLIACKKIQDKEQVVFYLDKILKQSKAA